MARKPKSRATKPKCVTWIPFREFFARADRSGLARVDAAQALLRNIKAPTAFKLVRGHLRRWEWLEEPAEKRRARCELECWRQHLGWKVHESGGVPTPEDEAAFAALRAALENIGEEIVSEEVPVPPQEVYPLPGDWARFEAADSDCMAHWVDDDDDPEEGGGADLIAGRLWWWSGSTERDEWAALEIDEAFAKLIIEHHGALVAPFSDEELAQVIKAWAGSDGDAFWNMVRDGPRLNRRKQAEVRREWRTIRGTAGKIGRPRTSS